MRRTGSTNRQRSKSHSTVSSRNSAGAVLQPLETRQLLSAAVITAISPVLAHPSSPSQDNIDLGVYLGDSSLPTDSTIATFTFATDTTLLGKTKQAQVQVALTDDATPITVANFLRYVNNGLYNGTFLHRAVDISSGANGSPSDAATIDQGGGYYINNSNPNGPQIASVPTFGEITNEASTEEYGNVAGTIAMARTSDVNSASSEWYFNVSDNTDLDTSSSNSDSSDTTGYCVFGKIVGNGLATLTTISELPTATVDSALGLTSVPVAGLSETQATATHPLIGAQNLVYVKSVTAAASFTYTATSSDPSLVRPIVNGHTLSFAYGGSGGTATITVNATEYDGTTASESFTITVPPTSSTATGPIVAADAAAAIDNGSATTIFPLNNDSDASSALNPDSLTITGAPTNGTATVDTTTGEILYTPTSGYTGSDTITYTVADEAGATSSPETITINVTAAPATVTIGTKSARSLVLTQPSGATSVISISGGTAVVTFAGANVTQTTSGGSVIVSGADATLASIVITNSKNHRASLNITGGAVNVPSVTDAGVMNAITARSATLDGTLNVAGIRELSVAATDDALLTIGSGAGGTVLLIPTATDTNVQASGRISKLQSGQWISDDGGTYAIAATAIGNLSVSGEFDDALDLSGVLGDTINSARIGGALGSSSGAAGSATWTVNGAIGKFTAGSANASWSLDAAGALGVTRINSAVAGSITASEILNLAIRGADSGTITSSGTIAQLKVNGADSGAISAGNIVNLNIVGDDSGGVTTSGSLQNLTVHGAVSGTISASALNKLTSTGALSGTVSVSSSINRISAAGVSSSISAGSSLSSLVVTGDLTGAVSAGTTVGAIRVTGNISGSAINDSGTFSAKQIQIGTISAGGSITNETITATGNIGTIKAEALTGSNIYAGVTTVASTALTFPTEASDFTNAAYIAVVRLSGSTTPNFSNSKISAETLRNMSLGVINTSNSGTAEGLAGEKLISVRGALSSGGTIDLGRAQLRTAAALSAYLSAKNITLSDFQINVIAETES